ncbi:MAG: YcxB family protein, partial [Vicinamibacteria bacterium]
SNEGATKLQWRGVERIESDEDFFFFFTTTGGFAIPRTAFTSAEESTSFFATAKELHRAQLAAA